MNSKLKTKKNAVVMCAAATVLFGLSVPQTFAKDEVLICSTSEDYRIKYNTKRLKEAFPDLKIKIDYQPTGIMAAKILSEKKRSRCDIVHEMEYGYLEKISPYLASLPPPIIDGFVDDVTALPREYGIKWVPALRNGGAILINTEVLKKKGLAEPISYEDLLKPEYKNLISMPNPKTSGTGYMFLKSLVNKRGEEKAQAYFNKLSHNILQYTSSGSGPVNALVQGEVGIGLGMTAQAVTEINKGAPIKIIFFSEGSPFTLYGSGIVAGREKDPDVQKVFNFVTTTLNKENNELFFPEKVYKDLSFKLKNYPTDIPYADMSKDNWSEKVRLLNDWKN
ncbi:extracellular solute-binding protein [uncultured Parasutterella sp.]|uniref:extracellular solute-binding protein n=1 Tax=uncultured Parasutterella sp. TaxID=1263098 RepID=UPI0026024B24|nr:extracellular solute-binding protein [uncultured Parasutterella sp.]